MMRALLILVLTAALGWSAYWWIGSTAKHHALTSWLEGRRAAGWVAESDALKVTGFPNRFDTIVRNLHLADPATGWSWQAPEFQILALSYKPTHVIAVWPGTQSIANPDERIDVTSDLMRGSVRLAPTPSLGLEQAIIELGAMQLDSTAGWSAHLADGQVAIRRAPDGAAPDYGYDVSLTATELRLPEPTKARLDPLNALPANVARANIRLTPVFEAPLDRHAVEDGNITLTTLNVGNISFRWGQMELTVTGRLDADVDGFADGKLNIIARNWKDMLDISVRAGWVPANAEGTIASALALLAAGTGETGKLDMTLGFRGGRVWIGPIPIGAAPRLQ